MKIKAIKLPSGKILASSHRYDFREYKTLDNKYYAVDGGYRLERVLFDERDFEMIELSIKENYSEFRCFWIWGTYGKKGKKLLEYKSLKNLGTKHIRNILKTQKTLDFDTKKIFKKELVYRENMYKIKTKRKQINGKNKLKKISK